MTAFQRAMKAVDETLPPDRFIDGPTDQALIVRAVLTAIREPSEAVDNGLVKFAHDMRFIRNDGTSFAVFELFQAGIDAALAEEG